jgi:hypothetical protein
MLVHITTAEEGQKNDLKRLRILEVVSRLQNGIRELKTIRLVQLWVAGGPAHLSFT